MCVQRVEVIAGWYVIVIVGFYIVHSQNSSLESQNVVASKQTIKAA